MVLLFHVSFPIPPGVLGISIAREVRAYVQSPLMALLIHVYFMPRVLSKGLSLNCAGKCQQLWELVIDVHLLLKTQNAGERKGIENEMKKGSDKKKKKTWKIGVSYSVIDLCGHICICISFVYLHFFFIYSYFPYKFVYLTKARKMPRQNYR